MIELSVFTYADLMSWGPCYDPVERGYVTADWYGTALDVLQMGNVSIEDRLWVVARKECLPERLLHEFAIWCAEQALALIDEPDPRILTALMVKRQWLEGNANDDELSAAWAAAWAAWAAAGDAARDARDAAWAARAAARAAAGAAARDARDAAWDAAGDAARDAAGDAQIEQLIKMIKCEYQITTA